MRHSGPGRRVFKAASPTTRRASQLPHAPLQPLPLASAPLRASIPHLAVMTCLLPLFPRCHGDPPQPSCDHAPAAAAALAPELFTADHMPHSRGSGFCRDSALFHASHSLVKASGRPQRFGPWGSLFPEDLRLPAEARRSEERTTWCRLHPGLRIW